MECDLIDTREKLAKCVRQYAMRLKPTDQKLTIHLPEMSAAENRKLAFQVNRLLGTCGCFQAGLASGSTVLLLIGYLMINTRPLSSIGMSKWILLILLPAGAALLAKAVTILWARLRLLWLVRNIRVCENLPETQQTSSIGGN